jgi:uncharacterized SAM-dependent methyltransferase
MHLPEYYVTRSEHEIFKTQSETIIEALQLKPDTYFDLIELGAGDGLKELFENSIKETIDLTTCQ